MDFEVGDHPIPYWIMRCINCDQLNEINPTEAPRGFFECHSCYQLTPVTENNFVQHKIHFPNGLDIEMEKENEA